jgi:hypothetical protein
MKNDKVSDTNEFFTAYNSVDSNIVNISVIDLYIFIGM